MLLHPWRPFPNACLLNTYRQAIKWHTLAASKGVAASHYHLGLMKAYGRGFNQDFSGAVIHFQQVAARLSCSVVVNCWLTLK
jgi:TPR repeat protein